MTQCVTIQRKPLTPKWRRLGNRLRQERVGNVRDETVGERHPRQFTLGAMRRGVKQCKGASIEINDPGMLRARAEIGREPKSV